MNHSLVLISTEIINTIPFPVFDGSSDVDSEEHQPPASAVDAGHAPPTLSRPACQRAGRGFPMGRGSRKRGGASGLLRGLALPSVWEQLLFPPRGATGPVYEPGGGGQGGRSSERQCVSPGGREGAGPVHIHLEEEDGAEDQHRGGGGAFKQFPGAYFFLGETVLV